MNSVEIIKMWWNSLAATNKAIKTLEKKKLSFKDGTVSIAWISLIFSVALALMAQFAAGNALSSKAGGVIGIFILSFIGLFVIGTIGLWILSWVFMKIARRHKGKAKFGKIAGFYGILAGALMLTFVPYLIGYALMLFFTSIPLIGLSLLGLGLLVYAAYASKVMGMLFEYLSDIEKLKVNEIGWIQGLTIGVLYFIGILLLGIAMQAMA